MNKQRKVLITVTYNEMGIIIDTKAEEVAQPEVCEYYALCRHGRDENKLRTRLGFCEYCHEDADGFVTPLEKNCHAFVRCSPIDGWILSMKYGAWRKDIPIRFCPICGRELKHG